MRAGVPRTHTGLLPSPFRAFGTPSLSQRERELYHFSATTPRRIILRIEFGIQRAANAIRRAVLPT